MGFKSLKKGFSKSISAAYSSRNSKKSKTSIREAALSKDITKHKRKKAKKKKGKKIIIYLK